MPEIDPQRLMNDLRHLRTIGKHGTGVVRPAFSTKDMEARQWLLDRMEEAGLEATMDGVANVFGRSPHPGRGILIGSHTDTQPQGGWLDGSLGVIYGLEIARAFAQDRTTAHFAVDVASWSDEEGTYMGMLGSRSFCGKLSLDDMQKAQNHQTDQFLPAALEQAGLTGIPTVKLDPHRYGAYLEAHVEQGLSFANIPSLLKLLTFPHRPAKFVSMMKMLLKLILNIFLRLQKDSDLALENLALRQQLAIWKRHGTQLQNIY